MLTVSSSSASTSQYFSNNSSLQTALKGTDSSTATASSSSASKSNNSTSSSSSSSTATAIPQAVITALENYVAPTQQAWNTLTQSLKAGDVSSAQKALSDYTVALAAATGSISTPTASFLQDLTTLGNSLQAGDLSAARTALASATGDAPSSADADVYWSESGADLDGGIAVFNMEHGLGVSPAQLANDIVTVDNSLREEGTYITDALVAQGYSQGTANNYASELTGIGSDSAQGNSAVDATRSTQWVQGLIQIADAAISAKDSSISTATTNAISTELSSILFSNAIDSGKQLQTLINYTLSHGGSGNTAASASNGTSGTTSASIGVSLSA